MKTLKLFDCKRKLPASSSRSKGFKVTLPPAKVPELALEYVRKQREVKYHETLFELLAKQYENARLDESRDAPVLQVVDRAIIPDKKSGPPRLLLILAAAFVGAILGALWVLLRRAIATLQQDPVAAEQFRALREAALKKL